LAAEWDKSLARILVKKISKSRKREIDEEEEASQNTSNKCN